ncbi:MAG: hypothetical protein AAF581_18345 [Planctomycetota bacterium]
MRALWSLLLCVGSLLCVQGASGQTFIRSDVDMDGAFGLTDTVYLTSYLYTNGPAPHLESGDVNDNGAAEIGDVVYHIEWLFLSGAMPSFPFPIPGVDMTPAAFAPAVDPGISITASDLTVTPGESGHPVDIRVDTDKEIEAIEFALTFDPAATEVDDILIADSVLSSANVEYVRMDWSNTPGDGFAWLAAIMDFAPPYDGHAIPVGNNLLIATVMVSVPATASVPQTQFIEFSDGVSSPPKGTLAVSNGGDTRRMVEDDAMVLILLPFIRGDANGDTIIDISDTVYMLFYFFNDGPVPPCQDAADSNNDGTLNIADAIYLLQYLFSDGPSPSEPFPLPGLDPDSDPLGCAN